MDLIKGEKTGNNFSPLAIVLLPTKLLCSDQASGCEIYTKSEGQQQVCSQVTLGERILVGPLCQLEKGAGLPRTERFFRQGEDSTVEDSPLPCEHDIRVYYQRSV